MIKINGLNKKNHLKKQKNQSEKNKYFSSTSNKSNEFFIPKKQTHRNFNILNPINAC